jgi:hypothetical protein
MMTDKSRKWFGAAVLALAWPLLAQAATPTITPRQQKFLDAQQNPSPAHAAWHERYVVLIHIEPQLQRAVLFARCAKPGGERLLDPAYRAYVETVGGDYRRYLRSPGPASAMTNTAALWAIDQLTEAEYRQSLRWLTADDTLPLRNARDVGANLVQYLEHAVDVSSGQQNVAALMALKAALVQAGQLDPIVKAIAHVDPAKAALFESLGTEIPLDPDQIKQWYEVAYWLDKSANQVLKAYWSVVPQEWFRSMAEDPFNLRFGQGMRALTAYQRRGRVEEKDLHTLSAEELLGRKIAYYFGDLASDEVAAVPVDAHNWMWKQAQAYIARHRAAMCSQQR